MALSGVGGIKSETLTVMYAQEIPYYTHITTQVFNAGKMIARIY